MRRETTIPPAWADRRLRLPLPLPQREAQEARVPPLHPRTKIQRPSSTGTRSTTSMPGVTSGRRRLRTRVGSSAGPGRWASISMTRTRLGVGAWYCGSWSCAGFWPARERQRGCRAGALRPVGPGAVVEVDKEGGHNFPRSGFYYPVTEFVYAWLSDFGTVHIIYLSSTGDYEICGGPLISNYPGFPSCDWTTLHASSIVKESRRRDSEL